MPMGKGFGCDPAELPQASHWPDVIAEIEGETPTADVRCQRTLAHSLNGVWALLAEHPRVELAFWALAVAARLDVVNGFTSGDLALRVHVSEADFSKTVNHYCDLLKLPRPPALKSAAARAAYSRAQKADHWRDRNGRDYVLRKPARS